MADNVIAREEPEEHPIAMPIVGVAQRRRSSGRYVANSSRICRNRNWSCPICYATTQPRSLHPCGHSICVHCVDRLEEEQGNPPRKKCPLCNKCISSTAVNYAVTDVDHGAPGSVQAIQHLITTSLSKRAVQNDALALAYAGFIAAMIDKQRVVNSLIIKISYTWAQLEGYLRERKIEPSTTTRLNVHALFVASMEHIGLTERYLHICIAPDTYELELIAE